MNSTEVLPRSGFALVDGVHHVNHKPHPYMIGGKHISYASDHWGGILGEETLRKIPCAERGCNLPYDQHISDKVAFVKLTANCTNKQLNEWLKSLLPWAEGEKIDGFAFIKTEFEVTE